MTSWRFRHYGLQVAFIFLLLAGLACAVDPADKAVDQALHQLASGSSTNKFLRSALFV
jgi:hypothetical protein